MIIQNSDNVLKYMCPFEITILTVGQNLQSTNFDNCPENTICFSTAKLPQTA